MFEKNKKWTRRFRLRLTDLKNKVNGRGVGQVVSVLSFYSDDLSSNTANVYSFFVRFAFEKTENKQKEAVVFRFKKLKLNI